MGLVPWSTLRMTSSPFGPDYENFGKSLSILDRDADGHYELAIGSSEDLGGFRRRGMLTQRSYDGVNWVAVRD